MRPISIASNLNQACSFHMHVVHASKEVLKTHLRCNPRLKLKGPKNVKRWRYFDAWFGLFEKYIYSQFRTIITCIKSKVCITNYLDPKTFFKRNIWSISDLWFEYATKIINEIDILFHPRQNIMTDDMIS